MPGGQDRPRILILEDGLLLAMEIEEAVHRAGYAVIMARTLGEAWAALERDRVDGAVLDYFLPDGSAGDLALHLAALCPVAFISGYGRQDFDVDLHHIPLFDKPVDMDALMLWLSQSLHCTADCPGVPLGDGAEA
jgi:DNA-binding NtrC family response regulator